MLSLRLVLATLMGSLVLVCFAQPQAPEVSISIVTIDDVEYVRLNWEAVEGAEAYNIYSSSEADPEDWGDPLAMVEAEVTEYTIEESIDELGGNHFFNVTSYGEADIPDWLVLVDGDQFNGDVNIDPFLISKYPVTRAEYRDLMGDDREFSHPDIYDGDDNYPANRTSWFDAIEYCNRLSMQEGLEPVYTYNGRADPNVWYDQWPGWNEQDENHTNISCNWEANGYRLPTEAEWNHAANAAIHPAPFNYSGSDEIDEVAWYNGNSDNQTHPVGELEPNGLDLYEMSGNVWEWCWDIFGGTFPSGGDNPRGDGNHALARILRGGSHRDAPHLHLVTYRYGGNVTFRYRFIGFRVCRIAP